MTPNCLSWGKPGTAPWPVQLAVLLMYVSGGLALISGVAVGLGTGMLFAYLVVAIVEAGLWVCMAVPISNGHSSARAVGSVLFGFYTLTAVLEAVVELGYLYVGVMRAVIAFEILRWVLSAVIVGLLWNRQSSRYYRHTSASAF